MLLIKNVFLLLPFVYARFVPPITASLQVRSNVLESTSSRYNKDKMLNKEPWQIISVQNIRHKIESILNNYTSDDYADINEDEKCYGNDEKNQNNSTKLLSSSSSSSSSTALFHSESSIDTSTTVLAIGSSSCSSNSGRTNSKINSSSNSLNNNNSNNNKSSSLNKVSKLKGGKNVKKRILLLMSDTGGGHRASAQALDQALQEQFPGKFECNIMDIWTDHALAPFNTFVPAYRFLAKHPLLWRAFYIYGNFWPTKWFTEWWSWKQCYEPFKLAINSTKPDLVVSVHPLCQRIPCSVVGKMNVEREREANHTGKPFVKIPLITVVTDLGGAHSTWFDQRTDAVFVPSLVIRDAALKNKIPAEKIVLRGLPVRPSFWKPADDKDRLRKRLGLTKESKTVLLMGGGDGVGGLSAITFRVAKRLSQIKPKQQQPITTSSSSSQSKQLQSLPSPSNSNSNNNNNVNKPKIKPTSQMIVICGHNKKLSDQINRTKWPSNVRVVAKNFITNVDEYMAASDCLITKAGPGTIAEAMIRGLPIILSSFLPGQEAGNVPYVIEGGFGVYTGCRPNRIANTVYDWFTDDSGSKLKKMSENALAQSRPQATYEIARDIAGIALHSTAAIPHLKDIR